MSTFEQDLQFGQRAEERVRDILCEGGAFVSKFNNCRKNDFQLQFQNQTHRVEVKCEDRQSHTGNICIETNQGRPLRPSGIAASEATICIHTLAENVALYRRANMALWLREQMQQNGTQLREATSGFRWGVTGDNNNHSFILPLEQVWDFDWFDYLPTNQIASSELWKA